MEHIAVHPQKAYNDLQPSFVTGYEPGSALQKILHFLTIFINPQALATPLSISSHSQKKHTHLLNHTMTEYYESRICGKIEKGTLVSLSYFGCGFLQEIIKHCHLSGERRKFILCRLVRSITLIFAFF